MMSFCKQCGVELRDGVQFCPSCGTPVGPVVQQPRPEPVYTAPTEPVAPETEFDPQDVQQNKVMAILSYFGILVLVPIFAAKESKFARYHANQGLILLICEVAYGVIYGIIRSILLAISYHLSFIVALFGLVYILFFVLWILGIANAAGGKAKELPIIGKYQILK